MPSYLYRTPAVFAVRIPDDGNMQEALAQRYGGQVKGTRLQPIDRVIEFRGLGGSEIEGKVGDWIVVNSDIKIQIYENDAFERIFTQSSLPISTS
jgi:hypothetical protein